MRIRRRRSRTPHRRKPGMKGDWIIGASENCSTGIPQRACSSSDIPTPLAFSLIDSQDLLDKEDKLTVVRTVGEIYRSFFVETGPGASGTDFWCAQMTVHEGIYVAGSDGGLPTATVIQLDPSVPQDLELDTWMWIRHTSIICSNLSSTGGSFVSGEPGDGTEPLGAHIDLRVKRRLIRGEELVYVVSCTTETHVAQTGHEPVWHPKVCPNLRLYAKF